MAKKNVAVYDGSNTYIKRFLNYMNEQNAGAFSLNGFSEIPALMEYLQKNRVDVLLFSWDEETQTQEAAEELCSELVNHPSIREFVYFGERRNSKSRIRHIDKYQAAGSVLKELNAILFSEQELSRAPAAAAADRPAELVAVYAPSPEEESAACAWEIAEMLAVRKEVLFLDLERFSGFVQNLPEPPGARLSDLIYFYKTNPKKLTECLNEGRQGRSNPDVLTAPEDLEDIEEIPEREWPAFLQQMAVCGGYDAVVVHMAETFHNLLYLFDAAVRIYTPTSKSRIAEEKMRRLAQDCGSRGRKDLYERMQAVLVPSARNLTEKEQEEEWNW